MSRFPEALSWMNSRLACDIAQELHQNVAGPVDLLGRIGWSRRNAASSVILPFTRPRFARHPLPHSPGISVTVSSIPQLSTLGRAVSDTDHGPVRAARRLRNAVKPSGRPIVSGAHEPPTAP
jgi:hypothetical protein